MTQNAPREYYIYSAGTRQASWSRHYATTLKVAGSIPDGVNGIFTGAQISTQPPTEMNARGISWVAKAAGAWG